MSEYLSEHVISSFTYNGKELGVSFVETMAVTDGVECDVYKFDDYNATDFAVIRVVAGKSTPVQRVLAGQRTVEGHVSGSGQLTIVRAGGRKEVHIVTDQMEEPFFVDVDVGDVMQWQAAPNSQLIAYEICFPPYQDGRFENIETLST